MDYKVKNMRICIEKDYSEMSKKAAEVFACVMKETPSGVFGFATGGTPVGLYKELIDMNKNNTLDFSEATTFNLDEYFPIKASNNQSYRYFMEENLFNHINIKKEKINIPNGEADDINEECKSYENRITQSGGIDLQILGIGMNGHIGFNEPTDHFPKDTHGVELQQSTIEANARFFDSIDEVPKTAVTMGIKSIMSAKSILLVVNGAKKAGIVKEMLFGNITPQVPASILQLHPNVVVILDEEAAEQIKELL